MVIALGFWSLSVGYALAYTAVQWFTTGGGSLAQNLGLTTALTPLPGKTSAATPGSAAAAQLASEQVLSPVTAGPSGTGAPSSGPALV